MGDKIKFHLDENIESAVAKGLRLFGIDVTTTPEQKLIASVDEDQLIHATQSGRVLVTKDDDFLKIANNTIQHAGIAYTPQHKLTTGQISNALKQICDTLQAEDLKGQVIFLKKI